MMERILFDSYRKFKHKNPEQTIWNLYKHYWPVPFCVICEFIMAFITIVLLCFKTKWYWQAIIVAIDYFIILALYFYIESLQIGDSNIRISDYQKYLVQFRIWLSQNNIPITQNTISKMKDKIIAEIKEKENVRQRNNRMIEFILKTIIFPLMLTIYTQAIRNEVLLEKIISRAICLLIVISVLTIICYIMYAVFNFYNKYKLEQLKLFSRDLQSILDTIYESVILKTQ